MRLAVCSKEPLFRECLASLLSNEGNFDIVAREAEPRSCLTASKDNRANIIVVDSGTISESELEFFMGARAYGDFAIAVVAYDDQVESIKNKQPDAVITRDMVGPNLFRVLRELGSQFIKGSGRTVRETRRRGYHADLDLTRREYEVSSLVAKGYSNRKIAQTTGLREQSVKNLVSLIMRKLKCDNRVQLALRLTHATVGELES